MTDLHIYKGGGLSSHSDRKFMFCIKTSQSRTVEKQRYTATSSKTQSAKTAKINTMSKVRFIGEEDLPAEIESQRSQLDFSQIKKGPGCSGCYTLVFDTLCGHEYVFRKRCQQPHAPVCEGSEILFIHLQDIVLKRTGCTACRFLEIDNHRWKKGQKRKRGRPSLTPERLAAKMRLEEGKSRWKRQCLESDLAESADLQASNDVEIVDLTVEQPASE